MFRDAKVGDRVWSVGNGWGKIVQIVTAGLYPIRVEFNAPGAVDSAGMFTFEGKAYYGDIYPSLFWSEVEIVPPPRPKRKIKKVIEGWVGLYREHHSDPDILAGTTYLHATKDGAERGIGNLRAHYGDSIFIRHEYEVEE